MRHTLRIIGVLTLLIALSFTATAQNGEEYASTEPARIYLFRPKSPVGMAVIYAVFIGEKQIGIARNGFHSVYEITGPGEIEVWGETEKKMSLMLDVEPGKEYYVKCAVKMGAMTGRPKFTLEEEVKGKKMYDKLAKK